MISKNIMNGLVDGLLQTDSGTVNVWQSPVKSIPVQNSAPIASLFESSEMV